MNFLLRIAERALARAEHCMSCGYMPAHVKKQADAALLLETDFERGYYGLMDGLQDERDAIDRAVYKKIG